MLPHDVEGFEAQVVGVVRNPLDAWAVVALESGFRGRWASCVEVARSRRPRATRSRSGGHPMGFRQAVAVGFGALQVLGRMGGGFPCRGCPGLGEGGGPCRGQPRGGGPHPPDVVGARRGVVLARGEGAVRTSSLGRRGAARHALGERSIDHPCHPWSSSVPDPDVVGRPTAASRKPLGLDGLVVSRCGGG